MGGQVAVHEGEVVVKLRSMRAKWWSMMQLFSAPASDNDDDGDDDGDGDGDGDGDHDDETAGDDDTVETPTTLTTITTTFRNLFSEASCGIEW